jgi:magnesium chelatase family protein
LFLDELPEFRRSVLESLRQPLEEGAITISRVRGSLRLPARFQLVGAMNPCPCGGSGSGPCRCTPLQAAAYRSRISGPLLDRIDLHVEVSQVAWSDLVGPRGESTALVAARVLCARARQTERGAGPNCLLAGDALRRSSEMEKDARDLLAAAMNTLHLSARGHDRVVRVARTVADLDGTATIGGPHVAEALQFRRCSGDTGT